MAGARVGRQQLASALEHDGAERATLRQREPLPDGLEERVLLGEQPRQRGVQMIEAALRPPAAAHVVPGLVREPLNVVGQVAGELHDRRAEARFRLMPLLVKPRSIQSANRSAGIFCRRITGPAL